MEKTPHFEKQRKTVADLVDAFLRQYFGYSPESVKVLMDQELVVVRVDKFLSPAEVKMGEGKRAARLLHEMYSKLFDQVKASLEAQIEKIMSKDVMSSQINISIESELCVMNFFLSRKSRRERSQMGLLTAPRDKE